MMNITKFLSETHPEYINEFDHNKNNLISFENLKANSSSKVWWKCSLNLSPNCIKEWEAKISHRTKIYTGNNYRIGCDICANLAKATLKIREESKIKGILLSLQK